MVIEKQTQMKLSLLALTIACALQPAWAGGYSLQQANRAELKQDKWSCGQCKLPQESRGTLEAGVAYNDGDNAVFANSSGTDADGATGTLAAMPSFMVNRVTVPTLKPTNWAMTPAAPA